MIRRLQAWLAGIGVAILGLAGIWLAGRREGRQTAEADEVRRRADAVREAQEVQDEIRSRSDGDVHDALRKWMRDP